MAAVLAPMTDKLAKQIGMDRVAIRRLNGLRSDGYQGGSQGPVTSSFIAEALDQGSRAFDWESRDRQSRDLGGSKKRGIGVGIGYHGAGGRGYDGLLRITPDGILQIHSGVGNLGTYSYASNARTAAESNANALGTNRNSSRSLR